MQFYADSDSNGNIAGFYNDDVHGENIPETAVPITEAEWQDSLMHPNKYIVLDGALTLAPPIPPGLYRPRFSLAVEGWIEGLTQEEIDAINAPKPPSLQDQVTQLQTESVDTMLALTEVYETNAVQDAVREQEGVDTMLALTEAYELILQQQATIESLTTRIAALETGGGS